MKSENDRSQQEADLLREETRIQDARMAPGRELGLDIHLPVAGASSIHTVMGPFSLLHQA